MPSFIPERPLYRKERLLAGFPTLVVFALLFTLAVLNGKTDLFAALPYLPSLIALVVIPCCAFVFWFLRGRGYGRVLRLRAPFASHIPLIIAAFFALYCGSILLSLLCGGTDTLANTVTSYLITLPQKGWQIVVSVLGLAVLPALAEELFFRGILVAEYERRGAIRAVLMSALLFALCHFDLSNLLAYLLLGTVLALVVLVTDSLPAAMLLHACFNVLSLFCQRYVHALYTLTGSPELFLFIMIFLFVLSVALFLLMSARQYRQREQNGLANPRRDVPWNVQFYTILDALIDPPVLLCIILSIVGFILL